MSVRNYVAALAATSLIACASNQFGGGVNQCNQRGSGWMLSPEAPANNLELLALQSEGRPVREQLVAGIPLREVWFSQGSDRLMVCRYEVGAEVCPVALTVEFTRASNRWSAGPVESRICAQ